MPTSLGEARRVDALFKVFSSDYLLREQFVTDPAQIMNEYVHGVRLDPDEAAIANHLIYAVVSNPRLLNWLRSYSTADGEVPGGNQFSSDLAAALARDGDEQSLLSILRAAGQPSDMLTLQTGTLRALVMALRRGKVFAGTEMSSPGTEVSSPGTEVSSPGTEVSPGAVFAGPGRVFAGTEMSSPGTEMSPGRVFAGTEMSSPGTEMSPGTGTEMSPGRVFAGTEMSSPGTEMSPGTGTEMSPGRVFAGTEMSSPGTEMSPGRVFAGTEMSSPGTEMSSPGTERSLGGIAELGFESTLSALVAFAGQLRRSGALNELNFR